MGVEVKLYDDCLSHIPVDQEITVKTASIARKQLFTTSSKKQEQHFHQEQTKTTEGSVLQVLTHSKIQRDSGKCNSGGKNESQSQENKILLLKTCFSLSKQSQSTAFAEEIKVPLTYPHLLFANSFMHQ